MRLLWKTNHLCLCSPLIGGNLQVSGVICAAECVLSILDLAHPLSDALFPAEVS